MIVNVLKDFYDKMETKTYPIPATFVFVYNDYNTYTNNDPHLEECFDNDEVHEILDSVCDLFEETLSFSSEKKFIDWCVMKDNTNKTIYVYTMAQYIDGFGRRTLIPAICEYYGFINLNANAYISAIGCNKETMYNLLSGKEFYNILPPTIFLNSYSNIEYNEVYKKLGTNIIIKPISESCCIDTKVLKAFTEEQLCSYSSLLLKKYSHIMIQKYIPGEEIGVTVFCHNNQMYTFSPMQIIFAQEKEYLTHTDSFFGNYQLKECCVPQKLLNTCKNLSLELGFYCTTRYDFRYDGNNYYLFDLSPNPTLNGYTSSNLAAQVTLQNDSRAIFRLMAYEKIQLFEPSFN